MTKQPKWKGVKVIINYFVLWVRPIDWFLDTFCAKLWAAGCLMRFFGAGEVHSLWDLRPLCNLFLPPRGFSFLLEMVVLDTMILGPPTLLKAPWRCCVDGVRRGFLWWSLPNILSDEIKVASVLVLRRLEQNSWMASFISGDVPILLQSKTLMSPSLAWRSAFSVKK